MSRLKQSRLHLRRKIRTRVKIQGKISKPRLSVFRSHKNLYVQLIDDSKGITLVAVHTNELQGKKISRQKQAYMLGELIAKKAQAKKVRSVVFDRGPYKYHGLAKAIAEGARKGGLKL